MPPLVPLRQGCTEGQDTGTKHAENKDMVATAFSSGYKLWHTMSAVPVLAKLSGRAVD